MKNPLQNLQTRPNHEDYKIIMLSSYLYTSLTRFPPKTLKKKLNIKYDINKQV